uniref:DH domain-containing protein n=1 Tax=Arcella intermedia TaxID=1963864 RepID=A0A6B2L0U6_9EUKA
MKEKDKDKEKKTKPKNQKLKLEKTSLESMERNMQKDVIFNNLLDNYYGERREKKVKKEKTENDKEKIGSDNEKPEKERKYDKFQGDKGKEIMGDVERRKDWDDRKGKEYYPLNHFPTQDLDDLDFRITSPIRNDTKQKYFKLIDDESISEEERITRQQQRIERRGKLIQELVRSEETHVEALKTVIVNYLSPLKEKKILSLPVIKKLFGNIELILTWNMDFLFRLKERLEFSDCFGDLVIKMSVILRQLFTQYNENYQSAQLTYTECLRNNKEFEQFIQKNNQASPNSNLLTSLYLPIQRMIMYDSFLKDIVLLTPPNHQDYEALCKAYKLLRSMDKAANRVVEKRKNLETVMKIQQALNGDVCIALPHRRHVFEEDVMLVVGKSHKERTLYLFNDILLIAKLKKKNKYDVDVILALDKMEVDDMADDRHLFKITVLEGPNAGDIIVYSAEHKPSWIQLLNSTKKKLHILPPEISDLRVEEEEHAEAQSAGRVEKELLENGQVPLTKKMLFKKIMKWSKIEDEAVLRNEIAKMASRIEKYELPKIKDWNG